MNIKARFQPGFFIPFIYMRILALYINTAVFGTIWTGADTNF